METVRTFKHSCIDLSMQDRTLKFRLQGPGAHFITRQTFTTSLDHQGIYDAEGMWKGEDNLEYFVAFRSKESVEALKDISVFHVYKDVKAITTNPNESIQFVRLYWVPLYVSNETFVDYFEAKGLKVITEEIIKDETGLQSGIRQFKVLGTKKAVIELPHLLDFPLYNFQSLVKVQGRDPMCLKCRRLGHLRNQCPEVQEERARRAEFQRRRGNARGWESQSQKQPSEKKPSSDSDSSKEASGDEETLKETEVNSSESKVNEDNDGDKTIIDNDEKDDDISGAQATVEEEQTKNNDDKLSDIDEQSEHDNETSEDERDDDVLMNDDDSISGTQPSSFKDKHSNRVLRSTKKKKKKNRDNK